jgi:dATP pyrophosphohydrolase
MQGDPQAPRFKRPVSVLVVVYNDRGEVLLLRRVEPPVLWQSVTGSLEWDEAPTEAARRELREETGLEVVVRDCGRQNRFPIRPEWRPRYDPRVSENVESVFVARVAGRPAVRINPGEHDAFLWLSRQEAAERVFSWTNRDAILEFVPTTDVADWE